MADKTPAADLEERPHKTTGIHLPTGISELRDQVAWGHARAVGGRDCVSALPLEIVESNRSALKLALWKTVR